MLQLFETLGSTWFSLQVPQGSISRSNCRGTPVSVKWHYQHPPSRCPPSSPLLDPKAYPMALPPAALHQYQKACFSPINPAALPLSFPFLLILSPLTPHLVSWINLTTRPKSSSASYFNFPTKFQSRGLGNTGICLLEGWGQVRAVNTCMMSLRVPSPMWDLGQMGMSGGCIFQGPDLPSITTILW